MPATLPPAREECFAHMRPLMTTLAVLASIAFAGNAGAEDLVVGVAAPLSGPSAILGKQVEAGAVLAADTNGATIKTVDD
ncbi:MAG: ABC transporter substrate-binding protein, partial [Mesorhizobium sp.]